MLFCFWGDGWKRILDCWSWNHCGSGHCTDTMWKGFGAFRPYSDESTSLVFAAAAVWPRSGRTRAPSGVVISWWAGYRPNERCFIVRCCTICSPLRKLFQRVEKKLKALQRKANHAGCCTTATVGATASESARGLSGIRGTRLAALT